MSFQVYAGKTQLYFNPTSEDLAIQVAEIIYLGNKAMFRRIQTHDSKTEFHHLLGSKSNLQHTHTNIIFGSDHDPTQALPKT